MNLELPNAPGGSPVVERSPERLEIRSEMPVKKLDKIVIVVPVAIMLLVAGVPLPSGPSLFGVAFLVIGLTMALFFGLVARRALLSHFVHFVLDRARGAAWAGFSPPPSSGMGSERPFWDLARVTALLLRRDSSDGEYPPRYVLQLVDRQDKRLSVATATDLRRLREMAREISAFVGVELHDDSEIESGATPERSLSSPRRDLPGGEPEGVAGDTGIARGPSAPRRPRHSSLVSVEGLFQIVFTAFGLLGLAVAVGSADTSIYYALRGLSAEGTVVDLRTRPMAARGPTRGAGGIPLRPVVEFRTPDGGKHRFVSTLASYPPAYERNDKVEVLYLPGEPSQARIRSAGTQWLPTALFGGNGLVFLCIGLWMRRRRLGT